MLNDMFCRAIALSFPAQSAGVVGVYTDHGLRGQAEGLLIPLQCVHTGLLLVFVDRYAVHTPNMDTQSER